MIRGHGGTGECFMTHVNEPGAADGIVYGLFDLAARRRKGVIHMVDQIACIASPAVRAFAVLWRA